MPRKLKALKEKVEILEKKLEYQNTTKKKELSRELDKFKAEVKQLLAGKMMSESIKFNVIKETSGNQIENQNIINISGPNETVSDFNSVKNDVQQLKTQIKIILKRIETPVDKIKSIKDLKKEFRAFFSFKGYSEVLDTNNLFKKAFWLSCMLTLFGTGMILVDRNLKAYQTFDVVTKIEVNYDPYLKFPAITFCLLDFNYSKSSNNLGNAITSCNFEIDEHKCSLDDFEYTPIYQAETGEYYDCYKFNGARNGSNHSREILPVVYTGKDSGFYMYLNLSKSDILAYHIDDNYAEPTDLAIINYIQPSQESGKDVFVSFKKTVDLKVPEPYSLCSENINSESSYLVKQFPERNITYRKVNCYNMCYSNYLTKHIILRNISRNEGYKNLVFDYRGNCSHLCPLECSSISFEFSKNEVRHDFSNLLFLNFFYEDRRYTEISQTIKTTESDLISNTGGVLGLFLELSFISAYRFINFLFDFDFV